MACERGVGEEGRKERGDGREERRRGGERGESKYIERPSRTQTTKKRASGLAEVFVHLRCQETTVGRCFIRFF